MHLTSYVLIQLHTRFDKASNNPITLCCVQVLSYTLFITAHKITIDRENE